VNFSFQISYDVLLISRVPIRSILAGALLHRYFRYLESERLIRRNIPGKARESVFGRTPIAIDTGSPNRRAGGEDGIISLPDYMVS